MGAPATNGGPVGAPLVGAPSRLGDIVGAFKSLATTGYIGGVKAKGWPEFRGRLWQRNYYEHIILSDKSYWRIREYIADNPKSWIKDKLHPNSYWRANNLRGSIE